MPRLIDADELLLRFIPRGGDNNFTRFVRETVRLRLAEMPTVDVEPVRHGRWIEGNNFHWYSNSCSCCGYTRTTDIKSNGWNQWKYCPMCGARMDGERREDETD